MRRVARSGFTLIELMAVCAIIAMILAVAAPRLLPLATTFGQEGAARELAAYGESAIQYAQLHNEQIYVDFDLEKGTYWVEHWEPEDPNQDDQEAPMDAAGMREAVTETLKDPLATPEERADSTDQMSQHFADFAEQRLRARAELVEPNRSKKNGQDKPQARLTLGNDTTEQRMVKRQFDAPLLQERHLPQNVFFESVTLPDQKTSGDRVEVVITPLGLERDVRIKLVSDDGDVLEVRWNPILGRGSIYAGDSDS